MHNSTNHPLTMFHRELSEKKPLRIVPYRFSPNVSIRYRYINGSNMHATGITQFWELDHDKLVYLYCSDLGIKELPPLPNIRILACARNRLIRLPEMPNLTDLDCSHNQLSDLPPFPNLRTLNCENNQIAQISDYPCIEFINCSQNYVAKLPSPINNIMTLICCNNRLASLPVCPKLQFLDCDKNRLGFKIKDMSHYRQLSSVRDSIIFD